MCVCVCLAFDLLLLYPDYNELLYLCVCVCVCVCPYRVAVLFAGDVGVNVLVSPVKEQLLLLSLIHPHDITGDLLNDALQLTKLLCTQE